MSPERMTCDLPLGRPGLVAHNELVLSGWAASPKGISGIAVQVDDRVWNASYGLDTPELINRLGDLPGVGRAGYRLRIDTSGWDPGPHYVTVAAFDNEGGRSAIEGSIEIRPFDTSDSAGADSAAAPGQDDIAMSLDSPRIVDGECEIEGALEVSGWTHADAGIESVIVTLDGTLQYEALRPIVRPDLLDSLGPGVAENAGFALRVHPSDCPPGRHELSVVALSRHGRSSGIRCDLTCRPGKPAAEAATVVDWLSDPVAPELRGDEADATDVARMWESRALLAEADAALSRAEANLARTAQEAALRALREAEAALATAAESYDSRISRPTRC
jgi:hypothetical protein